MLGRPRASGGAWTFDLAAATVSAAVNVGITGGAFLGSLALPGYGVRSTVLIGALLGVVALALAMSERLIPRAGAAVPEHHVQTGR